MPIWSSVSSHCSGLKIESEGVNGGLGVYEAFLHENHVVRSFTVHTKAIRTVNPKLRASFEQFTLYLDRGQYRRTRKV